jgi:hypothetical protein
VWQWCELIENGPMSETTGKGLCLSDHVLLRLIWSTISADHYDMKPSSDALSGNSLEQVLRAETENRAWSKTLRQRATALLNSRLAKTISFEEYTVSRQKASRDAAECKQRGRILSDEIRSRDERYVLRSKPEMNPSPKYTSTANSGMKVLVKQS